MYKTLVALSIEALLEPLRQYSRVCVLRPQLSDYRKGFRRSGCIKARRP